MEEVSTTEPAAEPATSGAPAAEPAAEPAPAAPEPAAEPAPSPEPAAPEPAAHDAFGWDAWDGQTESLPEDVRGWHSRFSERFAASMGERQAEHERAIAAERERSTQLEHMYEAAIMGDTDPRVEQYQNEAREHLAALEALREETNTFRSEVDTFMQAEATKYMDWVNTNYKDAIEALTPESSQQVYALMGGDDSEGMELHQALEIFKRGPEAISLASKAMQDGVPESYIMRMVNNMAPPSPPKLAAAPAAAKVVTGAKPAAMPKAPRKPAKPVVETYRERLGRIAKSALKADKLGR